MQKKTRNIQINFQLLSQLLLYSFLTVVSIIHLKSNGVQTRILLDKNLPVFWTKNFQVPFVKIAVF